MPTDGKLASRRCQGSGDSEEDRVGTGLAATCQHVERGGRSAKGCRKCRLVPGLVAGGIAVPPGAYASGSPHPLIATVAEEPGTALSGCGSEYRAFAGRVGGINYLSAGVWERLRGHPPAPRRLP